MRETLLIAWNELRLLFRERGIWINILLVPFVVALASGFANGQSLGASDPAPAATVNTPRFRIDAVIASGDVSADGADAPASREITALLDAISEANASIVVCPQQNTAADFCRLGEVTASATPLARESLMGESLPPAPLTREQAEARLQEGTTLALLVFPADFEARLNVSSDLNASSDLEAGEPAAITYISNPDLSAPRFLLEAVQAAVERVGGTLTAQRVGLSIADRVPSLAFRDAADRAAFGQQVRERAAALWQRAPLTVISETAAASETDAASTGASTNSGGGFSQSIPGMASMYVMFAIFPAAAAFIRERKAWLLQRMVTLPLTRGQILGGRLLARFTIGMIQYVAMFLFGLVLGVRYGRDPVALALLMVAFALCITALMTMLSTFLRSEGQAQGITLFLTLTLAPLGGAWWPLEIVPPFMQTIGHLSPVSWVMSGFRDLIFYGGSLATVWPNIVFLVVLAGVFFAVGVARFQFSD